VPADFASTFEKGRAIRTLLILSNSTDDGLDKLLTRIGGSKRTAMSRIQELVTLGLVVRTVRPDVARRMIYKLSPEGRRVADQIRRASEVFIDATSRRS
jgi:DNA-binding MarR family transcriptional regulator